MTVLARTGIFITAGVTFDDENPSFQDNSPANDTVVRY
jgi:hypothetical protein